jgi:subtilisin-like proprotein convertase family protein
MKSLERSAVGVVGSIGISCVLFGCSPEGAGKAPLEKVQQNTGQVLGSETEPNGDAASATSIGSDAVLRALISPSGEIDLYRFTAQANDRVYAATQTAFNVAASYGSYDTVLTIVGSDGTTVLEEDNNNGTVSAQSSSIAGTTLPATGTYYVGVRSTDPVSPIRPYDLHFRLRNGSPSAEIEPNDDSELPMPLGGGWISGSLSSGTDIDFYSIALNAGDTLFASLDLDPERDTVQANGTLAIGPFEDFVLTASDSGAESGPDSEALFITVKRSGDYLVMVSGTAAGTYHLSVSVHASAPSCVTYTNATPLALTDSGMTTATLNVPDDVRVSDLNVNLELSHAQPQDLDVRLVAPGGNIVGLFTDVGNAAIPNVDVTIDDEAGIPVSTYSVLSGMVSQPEFFYRLSWFDGQPAQGSWSLQITDDTATNTGTLTSWGLEICTPTPPPACPVGT